MLFYKGLAHQTSHSLFLNSNLSKLDQVNESKLNNTDIISSSNVCLNIDDTLFLCDTTKAWSMLKSGESFDEEPEFFIHRIDLSKHKIDEECMVPVESRQTPSHNIDYLSVDLNLNFEIISVIEMC